jgi:hypothetical protein
VVGQAISFTGHATDPEQGTLPAAALSWTLLIHHCTTPTQCHVHTVQSWSGVAGGTLNAPDHDYPSHLELVLRATDAGGLTNTAAVTLDPRTTALEFRTSPAGLSLAVGSSSAAAPFTRTRIVGSQTSISAPATQELNGKTYRLVRWSDGGSAAHNIVAPGSPTIYTASYAEVLPPPPASTQAPTIGGLARQGERLRTSDGVWSGSEPMSFDVQWLRCDRAGSGCAPIAGATGSSYVLTVFDIGSRIASRVTAANAGGSASVRSTATAVVERAQRGRVEAVERSHAPARPRSWRRLRKHAASRACDRLVSTAAATCPAFR